MTLAAVRPAVRTAPASRRPRSDGGPQWTRTGLSLAALAVALAGLHTLLQEASWWFVGAGTAAVVLLAGTIARRRLSSRVWPSLIALAAGVVSLTVAHAADTALLGVIPTPATLARIRELVDQGALEMVAQHAPATPEPGLVLLVAILMAVSAWAADLFLAWRHPALLALPLAGVLAIPLAVGTGLVDPVWFVAAVVLYLWLLAIERRREKRWVAATLAVAAIAGAFLAPNMFPGTTEEEESAFGVRLGINPLVNLGADLRRETPLTAIRYTTDSTEPVYMRLTTVEDFSGGVWGPAASEVFEADLAEFAPPTGLGEEVVRTAATAEIAVADILSRWLPTPYPTTSIEGLEEGDWYWEPRGLAVRSSDTGARGQRYTVSFLQIDPTSEQLAATVPGRGSASALTLALPPDVPDIITQTARTVTSEGGSAYSQALALQRYLRSDPFRYSEDAPVEQGFDGSGMDALAEFLEKKTGYCVHYASAMVIMARSIGIPARLAVGFQPGTQIENEDTFTVTSDDLHAWPELYFDGIGWLRFEPTPSRGTVPDYGAALADDELADDELAEAPLPTASADPEAEREREDAEGGALADDARWVSGVLGVLGALVGAVLLALVPAGVRAGVRAARVRRIRQGPDAAGAAWEELRDTARDHGWSAPDSETPRAFATRLEHGTDAAEAIGALRRSVEVAAYGPPRPPDISIAELREVRRAIAEAQDARTRWRAVLLPPSLFTRWRPEP